MRRILFQCLYGSLTIDVDSYTPQYSFILDMGSGVPQSMLIAVSRDDAMKRG